MYPNMFPHTYGYRPQYNPNNTIPFKADNTVNSNFKSNNAESDVQEEKHDESSRSNGFNLFGIELEIDDLIIIAIICLLFLDFNKNYTLIIILGLILLNTNLGDLLNLF